MVPACSSGTLTNVLPHRNAMLQMWLTCRCAIHWCGMSHWNIQLPILMSWVRPDLEVLPDLPHTTANAQLDAVMVVISRKLARKYRTNQVLNPGPLVCESPLNPFPSLSSLKKQTRVLFYHGVILIIIIAKLSIRFRDDNDINNWYKIFSISQMEASWPFQVYLLIVHDINFPLIIYNLCEGPMNHYGSF